MVAGDPSGLMFAVRPAVVGRQLGRLGLLLAALTAAPALVAVADATWNLAWRYGAVAAALAASGWLLQRLTRSHATHAIQANEAVVVGAGGFVLTALALTLPLAASTPEPLDALFEAVSGVTTTGLSTLATVQDKPASFLFARAWLQWCGGLGIVVLGTVLLLRSGPVTRRLVVLEVPDEDLAGGTRRHARQVATRYLALTGVAVLVLFVLSKDAGNACLYAMGSVSTGGFAPHDASVAGWGGRGLQGAVLFFCLAGAVPLVLYGRAAGRNGRSAPWRDPQVRGLLVLTTLGALCLGVLLAAPRAGGAAQGPADAALLAVSAQTTAGFSTFDVARLDPGAKLLVMLAMFVGSGLGSTGGGIKILRLLILLRVLRLAVARFALPPDAVVAPRIGQRVLEDHEVRVTLLLILAFVGVILLSWLAFLLYGEAPMDSLFEVVSATGTVGLSTGVTRPDLPALLKLVLCADMLLGRLEIIALLVLVDPRTWFGRRAAVA